MRHRLVFYTICLSLLSLASLSLTAISPQPALAQGMEAATPTWVGVVGGKPASGEGLLVKRVLKGSPAASAGLKAGDVIVKADGASITSIHALRQAVRPLKVGQSLSVEYVRDNMRKSASLKLIALPSQQDILRTQFMGQPLPSFSYKLLKEDAPRSSDSLKGKITIVEFWATWCGPCRQTSHYLSEYYPGHKDSVNVVAISAESATTIEAFLDKQDKKPTYPIAHDINEQAHDQLLVQSYPLIFILDDQLVVRKILTGFNHPTDIGKAVEQLKKM